MSSYQQRSSANSRAPDVVANTSITSAKSNEASESRFSHLRQAIGMGKDKEAPVAAYNEPTAPTRRYSKGIVMDVIPDKAVPRAAVGRHFPNAARRMKEFRDAPKPAKAKTNVLGNLKDSIFGVKEGAVVKGERNEDGSKARITPEDSLLWRRLHLRSVDKERQAAGSRRGADALKARKDALHATNKQWVKRREAMLAFQKGTPEVRRTAMKARVEAASQRHKTLIDERVRRLAFRDKVRTLKVEKIQAGRKLEQQFLKKHGSLTA